MKSNKRIYMDYASATLQCSDATRAILRDIKNFANPGSLHTEGVVARDALNTARAVIAGQLACKPREIIFASGGTEANNLAVIGMAKKLFITMRAKDTHWVVSAIEHPSVLKCFEQIEMLGGDVTRLAPNAKGLFTEQAVRAVLTPNTVCVSIGWANHEIGVVQPIRQISATIRNYAQQLQLQGMTQKIILHCDAGQAPLYLYPHVHTLGVDVLVLDSGKLYGPRGIAAIYLSNNVSLDPILYGGGQERGLRPGTENVWLATGMATAMKFIARKRVNEKKRLEELREIFIECVKNAIDNVSVNGDCTLPHIVNFSVSGIAPEYVVLQIDRAGVAIGTKSACKEGEKTSSVVSVITNEKWRAETTLRFSFGYTTTLKDIKTAVKILSECVALARKNNSSILQT